LVGAANRRWLVHAYPEAAPGPEHFRLDTQPAPEPADGEALARTTVLSMDPFPRMQLTGKPAGPPQIPLGSVMIGRGIGRVVVSRRADLRPGDVVAAEFGWQDYALLGAGPVRKLDPAMGPPAAALGLLGPSGLTGLFTVRDVAAAAAGETALITAAAGSVGSAACQVAKLLGCRVVGVARGPDQIRFVLDRLGVDAAVDADGDLGAGLRRAAPEGVHLALDTIGGAVHDAVLRAMRPRGRIVMAGFISGYGAERPPYSDPYAVVFKRLALNGFLLADHVDRMEEGLATLAGWLRNGRVANHESITNGLERAPEAFGALFSHARPGKSLVRVAPDTEGEAP